MPGNTVGRWTFYVGSGTANLSTGGHAYNLTKTGNNAILLIDTTVDSALANITINEGILGLQRATNLGDPTKTVTVDGNGAGQGAGGSILQFNNLSIPLDKQVLLKNGGQLYALQNAADSAGGNTVLGDVAIDDSGGTLNAGGVRADSAANSGAVMTIAGAIKNVAGGSSAATLTKAGPGTVTLSGTSTFNGTTNINDGTLVVNGTLPGGITMAAGTVTTTLAGTGTIGGTVTDVGGAVIVPGSTSAAGSVGTFTFGGLSLTGGGAINFDLSNDPLVGSDLITVNGDLSVAGSTNIAINGIATLASGSYRLINYTGNKNGGGALALLNIPPNTRRSFTLDDSTAHQINFSLTGSSASLIWRGGSSNSWDVANSSNLAWQNGASTDFFYNLDAVTFDDSTSNLTVNLYSGDVNPGSITVNTVNTYTITGPYKITGTTSLTKSGTGTLILANPGNDFSGAITINAGTLQVGDGVTGSASIGTGAITNNGQLIFNQTENHTLANVISGTGGIEQKGVSSVITLSGANTYDGATLVTTGTVQAGNNAALGSTVAGTTIANGATLDVNNMNLGAEPVTVQGPGVGSAGAIVNNNTATSTTPQSALRLVTLTGDTYFGGMSTGGTTLPGAANSGRWDIRGSTSTTSTLSTGGNPYKITKVGNNQVSLVGVTVDPALGDVDIQSGVFNLETTTSGLGDPSKTVTVASGAILNLYSLSTALNKKIVLNGGTIYAQSNTLATDNTIIGTVAVTENGGTLNTGGARPTSLPRPPRLTRQS